jgi:hypothetical protein
MLMVEIIEKIIDLTAKGTTIIASSIAIGIFIFKRKAISSALRLLLNYTRQLTLSDLKAKLERLNDFNASDSKQVEEVINIFNEIEGQIIGNKVLKNELKEVLDGIHLITSRQKEITEATKRSLVSQLRENIRGLDAHNFNTEI